MRLGALIIAALMLMPAFAAASPLDRIERAAKSWRGPSFEPNFAFPSQKVVDAHPWAAISYRREPKRYLSAVLDYVLEGQDRKNWHLQSNKMRGWYHMPWIGPGPTGREFIHGLTRERDFAPGELGPTQTQCRQNWAVAFFNPAGGYVLGRIWKDARRGRAPDLVHLPFDAGTVIAKLVFTEATMQDTPLLTAAPELTANINVRAQAVDAACPNAAATKRAPRKLRLIQIDLAIKEARADYKTGWVFASFVYDGRKPGDDPWTKLEPIGLMWGNDPFLTDADAAAGAKPLESNVFTDLGFGHAFGRGGRMNGLVDERSSACSSCHMAAQWPTAAHMTPSLNWAEAKCWFRNLDARYPFGLEPGAKHQCADLPSTSAMVPLDFSLQLAIALRNWSMAHTKEGVMRRTALGRLKRQGNDLTVNEVPSVELRR